MATLANILDGMTNVLNGLYPTLPVYERKRPPGPVKAPLSGYMTGDNTRNGAFYLVTGDADPIDDQAMFDVVTDTFPIEIHYLEMVPNQESSRTEDAAIRAKRLAVMTAFNVPRLPGVLGALMVGFDSGRPYSEISGLDTHMASVQYVKYMVFTPRGVAP